MPESRQWPGPPRKLGSFTPRAWSALRQLTDAIPAQLVGGVDGQLGVLLADDFALFAEGAGDDVNVGAVGDVVGDGAAGRQRFVVRVGVDKEQARSFTRGHRPEDTGRVDGDALWQPPGRLHREIANGKSRRTPSDCPPEHKSPVQRIF